MGAQARDGTGTVHQWPAVGPASVQGTLALDLEEQRDPPEPQGQVGAAGADVVEVPLRVRREVEQWVSRFAHAAVEIVAGDRPASQLVRWTTPEVQEDLARRARLVVEAARQTGTATTRRRPARPRVRSVHASFLRPDAVEVAIHVRQGERARAVAARFEYRKQRWVATALDFA